MPSLSDAFVHVDTITMHFGIHQLSEDLSILLLLQNVNKTPTGLSYSSVKGPKMPKWL